MIPWTQTLVDELRPVIAQRSTAAIDISVEARVTTACVAADPNQLHQVFSNLILNAADAIPKGGRIAIVIDEVLNHELLVGQGATNSGTWIHCTVSDTGVGIAPSVLERIFEPLFTTKKRGTGLGLAVVHQIVKAHGGVMSVATTLGQGTTFHVFLRSVSSPERRRQGRPQGPN
jgi:signal transduction histidine kinase